MNEKKVYTTPHSEVVLVCNSKILDDNPYGNRMSFWDDGHGGGGNLGDGEGDGDAKEYIWGDDWGNLWSDFDE